MALCTDFNNDGSEGLRLFVPSGAPDFTKTLQHVWGSYALAYNCYSYALDIPDHGHGTPGLLTHTEYARREYEFDPSPGSIVRGLKDDGLVRVRKHSFNNHSNHIIAAVCSEERDFHFLRLDSDGTWSHKDGKKAEPGKFFNEAPGFDPEEALKNTRDQKFIGFFVVPKNGIQYWQQFYWNPDTLLLEPQDSVPLPSHPGPAPGSEEPAPFKIPAFAGMR